MTDAGLRFHWMLPKGGEVVVGATQTPEEACRYRVQSTTKNSIAPLPDVRGWTHFARRAEEAGIDSVLISFSRYEPDPITVSTALTQATPKLRYMLAYRSGLMQPATFVQQINTLSALSGGRVSINLVAGSSAAEQRGYGDYLSHDDRYARAEEFLAVCQAFWRGGEVDFEGTYYRVEKGKLLTPFVSPDRTSPEIYISGHSAEAERLAIAQGTSWLRVIDTPEKVEPHVARARANGIGVCLRLCLICRPTREEAVAVMEALLADDAIRRREVAAAQDETQLHTTALKSDSRMHAEAAAAAKDASAYGAHWLNRTIFTGFVPYYGPVWTTLIGTPAELADAFLAYKAVGVTEFILSGWPEVGEVEIFGREVLPLVRAGEQRFAKAG